MQFSWFKLIFIELPFVSFVILFVTVTVKLLPTPQNDLSIFEAYYLGHLHYYLIPLALYCFLLVVYLLSGMNIATKYAHPGKSNLTFRTVRYAFALATLMIAALPVSFLATYVFAFGQVNYQIFAYNYGGADKAIFTAPQAIADEMTYADKLDITINHEKSYKKDILLLSMAQPDGLYKHYFLAGFPDVLYQRSYLPDSPMYLVNNTLVLRELSNTQLAIISPALGKIMVEHSLRNIHKPLPQLEILKKDAYVAYRNKHIENEVDNIDEVVDVVETNIASVSGYIETIEQSRIKNQEIKAAALAKKASLTCKTPEKCAAAQERLEKTIEIADNNIAKADAALEKNQAVLGTSVENKNAIITTRNKLAATEQFTDDEMGVFIPDNKIKMTLDENPKRVFDAYLATLVHEYFHYLSYAPEGERLDNFFEEALTEYFTRVAIKEYTGTDALELGYPMGYRIIRAMTKDIPIKELVGIYFSKDQQALEQILAQTYGKDFYARNHELFTKVSYLPFDQGLAVTNIILKDMNADPLTITDFIKKK